MLRKHAFDSTTGRQLLSLDVATPSALSGLELPAANFACLLAWDARDASADAVDAFVRPLLRAGASYFVCWGPDCERVHDIIDEMLADPDDDFGVPADACIMTSWHASETLRSALWFFLATCWPDDHYRDATRTALAVSVGSHAWAAEIAVALDHPEAFVTSGSDDDVDAAAEG